MKIKDRLLYLRQSHNLTQRQVADKLGMDRSSYTYYELGKVNPSLESIVTLARMYNVTTDYILGITDNSYYKNGKLQPIIDGPLSKNEIYLIQYFKLLSKENKKEILEELKSSIQNDDSKKPKDESKN